MTLEKMVIETEQHFVIRQGKGFEIYNNRVTHSVRVSQCGYEGQKGIDWCRTEIARRESVSA